MPFDNHGLGIRATEGGGTGVQFTLGIRARGLIRQDSFAFYPFYPSFCSFVPGPKKSLGGPDWYFWVLTNFGYGNPNFLCKEIYSQVNNI